MSQDWYAAMEHLKCAFKDESTVSNVGLANLSLDGDSNPGSSNDSHSDSDSDSDSNNNSENSSVQLEQHGQEQEQEQLHQQQQKPMAQMERQPLKELQQLGDTCGSRQTQYQIQLGEQQQQQQEQQEAAEPVNSLDCAEGAKKTPRSPSSNGQSNPSPPSPCSLVNIDEEFSYKSYDPMNEDRYNPFFSENAPCKNPEMPGIIDVSSIQSGQSGEDEANSNSNINSNLLSDKMHMLLDTSLEIPDDISGDLSNDLSNDVDLMSGSASSGSGGSTTDGGSLLLNVWNEDYEGNPDPETMKKLLEAKHLPRNIDPYVVNQIQRARIIQQLHEIDDDLSSVGSCNVMCTQLFLPRRCADAEDEDGSSLASDDSIVDTVIDINPSDNIEDIASYASIDASIEIEGLNHKRPKQNAKNSKYAIPSDKDYRPGATPKELVLMLPKRYMETSRDKMKVTNPHLPVQYAVGDSEDEMSSNGSSENTYQEKNMEFTLQRYDSTPHRIAELVLKGEKSAAMDILPPEPVLSCLSEELDQVTYKIRRRTDDDDPIEEDRSILGSEELKIIQREKDELLQAFHNRPPQLEDNPDDAEVSSSSDCQISEVLGIFNDKQSCVNINGCVQKHQSKSEDEGIKLSVPQSLVLDAELPLLTVISTESVPEQLSEDNIFKAGEVRSLSTSSDEDRQLFTKNTTTTKDDLRSMPLLSYSSAESASFDRLGSASQEENTKSCKSTENENVSQRLLGSIEEKDKENQGSDEERNTSLDNTSGDNNSSPSNVKHLKRDVVEKSDLEVVKPQNIKSLMEKRVLQSLGTKKSEINTGNKKEGSKICRIVNVSNCCGRQDPKKATCEGNDENFEELIQMADTSITTASSMSTGTGESVVSSTLEQEVVVGEAVEGIKFESPFSQMGMIIEPDQFEALKQLQLEKPDVDIAPKKSEACVKFEENTKSEPGSTTSEQYADMILEVTNVEDSMSQRISELAPDSDKAGEVTVGSGDCDVADAVEETAEFSSELKGMELFGVSMDQAPEADEGPRGANQELFHNKTIIQVGSNIEVSHKLLRDVDDECDSQSSMVAIIESTRNADDVSDYDINGELMMDERGEGKILNKEETTICIEDQLNELKQNMKKNSSRLSKITTDGRRSNSPAVSLNLLDSATEFDAVLAFQV